MDRPRLWALEDTREVIDTFEMLLARDYDLSIFTTLVEFRRAWRDADAEPPALLIADLMLPDGCFLDLLETEWDERPLAPVLVTSGLTDIESMRRCLARGAIDYIVKPFVAAELLVKIERGLRVAEAPGAATTSGSELVVLDHLTRCVAHAGRTSQPLTSREMQIMSLMRAAVDEPIKRGDIIRQVWGKTKVTTKCLDVHLSHLRSKVQEVGLEIRLLGGSAYQLVAKRDQAS